MCLCYYFLISHLWKNFIFSGFAIINSNKTGRQDYLRWCTSKKSLKAKIKEYCLLVAVVQSLRPVQLCEPVDCSIPGFPVLHHPLQFAQTLVHWVQPSHSVTPFSSCPQSFPASGSFPVSWLFTLGGQSIGTLASVFSINIQGWFPLGLTGLISLMTKGLSRVFSNTTVWKQQFFSAQLSL